MNPFSSSSNHASRAPASQPNKPSSLELYTSLTNINEQLQSPLFNGVIPPEIRDSIFAFALTDDLDLTKPYLESSHYTRPGHTHKRKTDTSLLLTCKRVYHEAYHLPLYMKTHTFFFVHHDRVPPHEIHDPVNYFSKLQPNHLIFLRSFHFHVQQFWFEGDFFKLCQADCMKHLVDLKITLRRSDWWFWEDNNPLAITPWKPFPPGYARSNDAKVMKEMWEEEKANPSLVRDFAPDYWGSAFQHLPKLKTLTMEFETEKMHEAHIDAIASHAKSSWKFPMGDRGILSAENGGEIRKWEWKGPLCMQNNEQRHQRLRAMMVRQQQQYAAEGGMPTTVQNARTQESVSGVLQQARRALRLHQWTQSRFARVEIPPVSSEDVAEVSEKPVMVVRAVKWNVVTI